MNVRPIKADDPYGNKEYMDLMITAFLNELLRKQEMDIFKIMEVPKEILDGEAIKKFLTELPLFTEKPVYVSEDDSYVYILDKEFVTNTCRAKNIVRPKKEEKTNE